MPLRPRLALWIVLSMVCIGSEALSLFTAAVLLQTDGLIGGTALAAVAVILTLPTFETISFTVSSRRDPPTLVATDRSLTFNVPALLQEPLILTRDDVCCLVLRPWRPADQEQKGDESGKEARRHRRARKFAIAGLEPSRKSRPNLSVFGLLPDMMIVLTHDMDVGRLVKRGTGWLSLYRFTEQPLRSAHCVRAIYADPADQDAARTVLNGWPITDGMTDAIIRRLVGPPGS